MRSRSDGKVIHSGRTRYQEDRPVSDPRSSLIVPLMKARVPAEVQLEFVARRHCAELGVAPGELRRRAVINLRDLRPELSLSWYPDVRAVTVSLGGTTGRGTLEAGLLLDDGFLEKLAQDVEGDLVVAAPARDVFVASGTGHPDGVDKLRWAVAQVWAEDRDNADPSWDVPAGSLLTHNLMVRRGGVWDVLTD